MLAILLREGHHAFEQVEIEEAELGEMEGSMTESDGRIEDVGRHSTQPRQIVARTGATLPSRRAG